jgi:divalent metal cation (Fe/Co/Zn/Cd) transporter
MHAQHRIRSALRWSLASVAWTLAASTIAVAAGLALRSLSLVAFGLVGLLDVVGSVVLVWHFRDALARDAVFHARDRATLLLIAAGMAVIATTTGLAAIGRPVHPAPGPESMVGVLVAAPSVVALGVLGSGKRRAGQAIESRALMADGVVSTLGAVFSSIALAGVVANAAAHWWWLDPAGSVVIAAGALALAVIYARRPPATELDLG